MSAQPGLDGIVPFRFRCQRSGRCCTGGAGYVWVEPDEIDALAAAVGQSPEEFAYGSLREVPDPRTGALRLSLRERPQVAGGQSGGCALLEGQNECTVYGARPRHCRQFPYWTSVLEDADGFEAARATCPGISPLPDPVAQERAFAELEVLYAELDAEVSAHSPRCELSGRCCRFEEAGHVLYATALETDYAVRQHPEAHAPEAEGRCPYHVRGLCTAREGRPLGCRTYFCDPLTENVLLEVHERYLTRVRAIEREHGYPAAYAPFPAQLADRELPLPDSGEGAAS